MGQRLAGRSPVITAMDLITPLGVGLEKSWERLVKGISGISRITLFRMFQLFVSAVLLIPEFINATTFFQMIKILNMEATIMRSRTK